MLELTSEQLHDLIKSHKQPDKQFYLDLLDEDKQLAYEEAHVFAVMTLLKTVYINKLKVKIKSNREEAEKIRSLLKQEVEDTENLLLQGISQEEQRLFMDIAERMLKNLE